MVEHQLLSGGLVTEAVGKARKGRPSKFTEEIATRICERLAAGEALLAICRDKDMPPEATVRGWVLDDREGFSAKYATAREIGYSRMADEILEIADDGKNDTYRDDNGVMKVDQEAISRSRLRVDTRKWLLSKALPKVYGDKVQAEITGKEGGPLEFIELRAVRPSERAD